MYVSRKKLIPISPGHAMQTTQCIHISGYGSVSLLACSVVLRANSEGSKGFMRDTWLGPNLARDAWKPQNRNVIRETSNACEAWFIL